MTVLPERWAAYAQHQRVLARATSLTDRCWGLESALIDQIDAIAKDAKMSPEETSRKIDTAARQNRNRKRILRIYGRTYQANNLDPTNRIEARATIKALAHSAGDLDFRLLLAVAEGISQATIAERLSMSPAAVRQRISRARRANDHLHR